MARRAIPWGRDNNSKFNSDTMKQVIIKWVLSLVVVILLLLMALMTKDPITRNLYASFSIIALGWLSRTLSI